MASLSGFDADQVEPNNSFTPVPDDDYTVVITDSEMKPNKKRTGRYLELTFQIQEGEHKNRLLWDRLNLENPNSIAVEIAQRDLAAICIAVDVMKPNDSVELHNLPLVIRVRCTERKDNPGEFTNEIKGYFKKESSASAGNAPAADKTPPWKRPS